MFEAVKALLAEAGARHSKADSNMIQQVHDHAVGLGADCGMTENRVAPWVREQIEAFTEATLRQADSMDAKRSAISKAVSQTYDNSMHYPYVRDAFDKHVVVQHGSKMFKHSYSADPSSGVVTLGDPQEVEGTYSPVRAQEGAIYSDEGQPLYERDIPQTTRDKAKGSDFAGKGTSFPILKAEDVGAALKSIGRAGSGNYDSATLKANILRIAKKKGFPIPNSDKSEAAQETQFLGDLVPLVESAMRADGTIPIKVIAPGWGSSGYYPAEVLERDGPKVFTKGTQMYLDHPTDAEESERPERSVKDLAAALTSDARWDANGKAGPGLYADAQVFEPFRPFISEASNHIGVSIRALGAAESGQAEGRTGPIIKKLSAAKSIDFVTAAGAGGKILQLYEAATRRIPNQGVEPMIQIEEKELTALRESAERVKRLEEAQLVRDGQAIVIREVSKHSTLPELTRNRLVERLTAMPFNVPMKDGKVDEAAITALVKEAADAEKKYLTEVLGLGRVVGMGSTPAADAAETTEVKESEAMMLESFKGLGMSEKAAQLAVKGR